MKKFIPDYHNLEQSALNKTARRIPLYDHSVGEKIMSKMLKRDISELRGDVNAYYGEYCRFFQTVGYDTVSFEAGAVDALVGGGALLDSRKVTIRDSHDLEVYPFDEVERRFKEKYRPVFEALKAHMPAGMKAIGGVGYGVFEVTEDLVGFENLCVIGFDEPEFYAELFAKVGALMRNLWSWVLENYAELFCVCRMGDDLGYKSNTMLSDADIKKHLIPQYKEIVALAHKYNKPFLMHSCGCIFKVMDDLINVAKIDAKHSNEDQIAPMSKWVDLYGDRIGNFGGVDTDHLVRSSLEEVRQITENVYRLAVKKGKGFALGSGNSIPDYVDFDKYMEMTETVRKLRGDFD